MRYLSLTLLHVVLWVATLSPVALFAIPMTAQRLPLADQGLFVGLGIYWCFVPLAIAILGGIVIDWISRIWSGKNYYSETSWSKTRRRTIVLSLLGAGCIYLHYWLAGASG